MLQRYIRALADLSINVKTYQPSISGAIARDELNTPVPSDCAKKCQQCPIHPKSNHSMFECTIILKSLQSTLPDVPTKKPNKEDDDDD